MFLLMNVTIEFQLLNRWLSKMSTSSTGEQELNPLLDLTLAGLKMITAIHRHPTLHTQIPYRSSLVVS